MKWNEWGFTPHLFTYRLNWARRTSWGWWYEWGNTALQTHDSKLSPVGLQPSTLSLGHVGCPQYSIFTIEQGGNILFFLKLECQSRRRICDLWLSKQAPGPSPFGIVVTYKQAHYLITDIKMMCYVFLLLSISWLAKRFQLLIFMTLMMYYIGLNIILFFICVVETHLCSTEAVDNVGLYNDVVIRAYNTDVLVIREWQCYIIKWRDRQFKWR